MWLQAYGRIVYKMIFTRRRCLLRLMSLPNLAGIAAKKSGSWGGTAFG
jgi:hypothetical protein